MQIPCVSAYRTWHPHDRKGDVAAHPAIFLARQKAEALDYAGVGFWGPIGRDPALPGGAAATAASSHTQVGSAIVPPIDGSGRGILDAPSRRRPLSVAGEEKCPEGGGRGKPT